MSFILLFFKSSLRELFVDKNRAVGVTMGETDNKKALDQRKKQLLKEKRKYGLAEEDESQISWEIYYNKVIWCALLEYHLTV